MCVFYKIMALYMYTIIIVKSERWYSAQITERRDSNHKTSDVNRVKNYLQHGEYEFAPFLTLHTNNTKSEFSTSELDSYNIPSQAQNNATLGESQVQVLNINNTIKNVNILRRNRPKRKYLRKRCPHARRKTKHMPKTKFLEMFQVVEFDHEPCTTSNGLEGTCLPEYNCKSSEGTTMGTCANGYGVCCVIQFRCNGRSAAPIGWLTNTEFPLPSTDTLSCTFTLDKASEDIIQVRLDFDRFELLPPTNGVCQYDQFIVSGQNINNIIPILCGINTGQHVYIEVSDVDGPITLTFQSASSDNRLFAIQVTQLTSSDELQAPSGCLQYFKQAQGNIESFNYLDTADIVIPRQPSYFNNLNYAICIERARETCSVTYTNAANMQIPNYDIDGLPVIPPQQAGIEILNCPSDWLLIAATRLCGERLNDGSIFQDFTVNAPITDINAGPIIVWFRSDESYVGKGFSLSYQQNSCQT